MVDFQRCGILVVEFQTDHARESFWQGVADDRDDTYGTAGNHRERQCVVAGDNLEMAGFVLDNLVDLFQRSRCLLDGNDILEVVGDANGGLGFHVYARPPRHIIHHHRQLTGLGDGLKVLIQTFLRGLVVVWTDTEDAVDTHPVGALDLLHNGTRIVAATIFKYWHAPVVHTDDYICYPVLLFLRQAWSLTRRRKDAQEVGTILYLVLDKTLQGFVVYLAVTSHWGDKGYAQPVKNIFHLFPLLLFLILFVVYNSRCKNNIINSIIKILEHKNFAD